MPLDVGQFANFRSRMLRSFRTAIEDWDEVCSALGAWEAQCLSGDGRAAAIEQHQGWVTELLSWGRLVQRVTLEQAFPDKALAERVKIRVQHLEDKLALWHRTIDAVEEQRVLEAAFR